MRAPPSPLRSIVIAGGGTAGWMAAAALAKHLHGTGTTITLVESSEIGTIGVGEATIPTIRRFYARLGMSDAGVMRATHATAKLGISFEGWTGDGSSFLHPFGLYGQPYGEVGFHHLWLRERARGGSEPIEAYSLGAMLALGHRMALPQDGAPTQLATYDWALHLDAAAFAQHLRAYAEASGVKRIDARIASVEQAGDRIEALTLDDGRRIAGDLFIDCTGFRALLIGQNLGVGYEDWSHWLPCDRAIAIQTENAPGDDPPPYTRAIAHGAGWQWRIPLQTRAGNGIVYASKHLSDDEALGALLADLPGKPLTEPRPISFCAGRRDRAWQGNCVALGLAAGFLEPLESTSIALIETGIERLKELLPNADMAPALADEFNDATAREMERVRDFIILHYKLAARSEPFWQYIAAMPVPETLERKLALWDARGEFVRYRWEMFHPASWLAIYTGSGRLPAALHPAVAAIPAEQARVALDRMRASVATTVAQTPTHAQFLRTLER